MFFILSLFRLLKILPNSKKARDLESAEQSVYFVTTQIAPNFVKLKEKARSLQV